MYHKILDAQSSFGLSMLPVSYVLLMRPFHPFQFKYGSA